MTDPDTAAAGGMYGDDGRPTAEGRQRLEQWSQQYEAELDHIARRWGVALVGTDVIGLPALFLLTPWQWPSVLATWLVAMAGLLVVAVVAHHRAQERRARQFLHQQIRLRELAGFTAAGERPNLQAAPVNPPARARAGLAF